MWTITLNADAVPPMLINTAIAVAQSGKTIFLEAGTFIEHVVVPKSLTIDGASMATSILDGTTAGTGSGISIDNGINQCID
ncbi:MAG: hypothetical protein IPP29_14915 [Bacteroidetes bacterium]|nr:hypothetical protein [Bacteroidota bacterium]